MTITSNQSGAGIQQTSSDDGRDVLLFPSLGRELLNQLENTKFVMTLPEPLEDGPRGDEPKRDEPRRDEPKKDEPRRGDVRQFLERMARDPLSMIEDVLKNGPQKAATLLFDTLSVKSPETAALVFRSLPPLTGTSAGDAMIVLACVRHPDVAKRFIDSIPPGAATGLGDAELLAYIKAHVEIAPAMQILLDDKFSGGKGKLTDKERDIIAKSMSSASQEAAMFLAERVLERAPLEAGVLLRNPEALSGHARGASIFANVARYAPEAVTAEVLKPLTAELRNAVLEIRDATLFLKKLDPRLVVGGDALPMDEVARGKVRDLVLKADVSKLPDAVLHRSVQMLGKIAPDIAAELGFRNASRFKSPDAMAVLAELTIYNPEGALDKAKEFLKQKHMLGKIVVAEAMFYFALMNPEAATRRCDDLIAGPLADDKRTGDRLRQNVGLAKAFRLTLGNDKLEDPVKTRAMIEGVEKLGPTVRNEFLSIFGPLAPHILIENPSLLKIPEMLRIAAEFAAKDPAFVISRFAEHKNEQLLRTAAFALGAEKSFGPEAPLEEVPREIAAFKLDDKARALAVESFKAGLAAGKDIYLLRGTPPPKDGTPGMLIAEPAIRRVAEIKAADLLFPATNGKLVPFEKLSDAERASWTPRAILELKMAVSRNLPEGTTKVTADLVQAGCKTLFEAAGKYDSIAVAKGRDVYVLANSDNWRENLKGLNMPPWVSFWAEKSLGEPNAFAGKELMKSLKAQEARSVSRFSPAVTDLSPSVAKNNFLATFETAKIKSTFIFAGHGSPTGLASTGGDVVNGLPTKGEAEIAPGELAEVLIRRAEALKAGKVSVEDRDLVILDSCFSQDYMRAVFSRISEKCTDPEVLARLPIFAVASEHGHLSYGRATKDRDSFVGYMFRGTGTTTLKDLRFLILPTSNPGLFFLEPGKSGEVPRMFQLGSDVRPRNYA